MDVVDMVITFFVVLNTRANYGAQSSQSSEDAQFAKYTLEFYQMTTNWLSRAREADIDIILSVIPKI